jgi:hypothetical protein
MVIDFRTRRRWHPPVRPAARSPIRPCVDSAELLRIAAELADHAQAMRTIAERCRERIG